jgi:hypothetical protein
MANNLSLFSFMWGPNRGITFLHELCNDPSTDIIAIQEHWLAPGELHQLTNIHANFAGIGISSMNKVLASGILSPSIWRSGIFMEKVVVKMH